MTKKIKPELWDKYHEWLKTNTILTFEHWLEDKNEEKYNKK